MHGRSPKTKQNSKAGVVGAKNCDQKKEKTNLRKSGGKNLGKEIAEGQAQALRISRKEIQ